MWGHIVAPSFTGTVNVGLFSRCIMGAWDPGVLPLLARCLSFFTTPLTAPQMQPNKVFNLLQTSCRQLLVQSHHHLTSVSHSRLKGDNMKSLHENKRRVQRPALAKHRQDPSISYTSQSDPTDGRQRNWQRFQLFQLVKVAPLQKRN